MKTAMFSAAAVLTLFATASSAHHSFAMFDQTKETTLNGTLKELQWTNPHIWVQVMVKDPATGQDVEWTEGRDLWWDDTDVPWVAPSPNMPSLATATVYPGMCLLEATAASEGRDRGRGGRR